MADAEPSKPTKRRLRAPSPTVREQAVKATADNDKPKRSRHMRKAAAVAGRPLSKVAVIFHRQPFRFIGHVLVPPYFRSAFRELKLVTWPSGKQTRQLTFAVLAFAVAFGGAVAIIDLGLDKLFKALLLK